MLPTPNHLRKHFGAWQGACGTVYSITIFPQVPGTKNAPKIESRPAKQELGDYLFYIDCEGSLENKPLETVLEALRQETVFLKILGSYPQLGS